MASTRGNARGPKLYGVCTNDKEYKNPDTGEMGCCPLCKSQEVQSVSSASMADLKCHVCGKRLKRVPDPNAGGNKGLIYGGIGAVVVAALVGGYFWLGGESKDSKDSKVDTITEVVEEVTTAPTDTAATTAEPVTTTEQTGDTKGTGETGGQDGPKTTPTNYLTDYRLPFGLYTGPASNGVPDGIKGEITVTQPYEIDLKTSDGATLKVSKGDKIVNAKFRDGKLVQGYLKRKNGEGKDFIIGI